MLNKIMSFGLNFHEKANGFNSNGLLVLMNTNVDYNTAVQSQMALSAHLTSGQILPFGCTEQSSNN